MLRNDLLTQAKQQSGAALIESLVAILIISFGILAVVGMQANAVQATTDTRFRAEAIYQIDKIIGQMLLNVDRSSAASMQTSLNGFLHNTANNEEDACLFDGASASNSIVSSWIDSLTASGGLPGTTTNHIQIRQDTSANAGNRMIITIRWQAPWESNCRQQSTVAYIN